MGKILLYILANVLTTNVLADNKMILDQHGIIQAQINWSKNEYQEDVLFGDIKFKPNLSTKLCQNISFIQIARVRDNKNKDLIWDKTSGQSTRNLIRS